LRLSGALRAPISSTLAAAALTFGCATPHPVVKAEEVVAPLDPELQQVAGARAFWLPEREFGGRVYVVVVEPTGQAAPETLVLVHGLGTAGLRDFYPVLPQLAHGRRVVAFDLPGFARSRGGNEEYTPARYAATLSHVIEETCHGAVDVLGHSMGGAIALMHAGTYPAEVRRLILVDAAGVLHREAWFGHHLRRATDPAAVVFPGAVDELNQIVNTVFRTTRVLDPVPEIVLATAALRQQLLKGDPGRIAALGLVLTDFSEAIAATTAPTLVVWGSADEVAPPRTGELLVDRLREARLTVLEGVGHNVMAEAPLPLVIAVAAHLDGAAAGAASPAPSAEMSRGDVSCSGQADLRLGGAYDVVDLDHCERVRLERVSMRKLVMRHSSAVLLHGTVTAGVTLASSHLIVTGGRLDGDVALALTDSDVDLAGVSIDARQRVVRLAGTSKAVFSVCPARTPSGPRHLHGVAESSENVVTGWLP
jgi:pimeloyl-ACP methyl ester carboxylesterase